MTNIYSQELIIFSKMNHKYFCAKAYASKDVMNFCRHFFLLMMNRYNLVICETSITSVIHRLTGWDKDAIKRAIKRLEKNGELQKQGHKRIIINDLIANRLAIIRNHNGYTGKQPFYSEEELKVIEELDRIIPRHPKIDRKEIDMKQLFQKLDVLEEQNDKIMKALEFLMSKAKGEDVEEVHKLYLVKNED